MEKNKYNSIDNIIITIMILIAGFGGFTKLSFAMALPIGIVYGIFRNFIINYYNNKKGLKDNSENKIEDIEELQDDEFDFDDDEINSKKKK